MTAFLGTVPARLGTTLAVVLGMLGAFLGAGIANLGANAADLVDERRAAAHEGDAQTAHFGAVKTHPRAIGHASQTSVGAVVTLLGTLTASSDTGLVLLMRHDLLLLGNSGRLGLLMQGQCHMRQKISCISPCFPHADFGDGI